MVKKVFSKSFQKEFEVEVWTDNGYTDMTKEAIDGLLEGLEGAVEEKVAIHADVPGFCWVEHVIKDDTGREVTGIGEVNLAVATGISKQSPIHTAMAQAKKEAVKAYYGFPRVLEEKTGYAEVANTAEKEPEENSAPEKSAETKPAPKRPGTKKAAPAPAADDPGEYVITFGNALKGKKVSELTQSQLEWLAGDSFDAKYASAKAAKEAAQKYLAAK